MDVASSRRYKKNPSFSSSLLDEIYRSIDERDIQQTSNVCKERKKVAQVTGRRSSAAAAAGAADDVDRNSIRNERGSFRFNSSSRYCDDFMSQNELMYGVGSKPKPIRTNSVYQHDDDVPQANKAKNEGKFVKTKSKALKIYSDLKKVKQPISPGGRLTRLLNSIFSNGSSKKMNGSSSGCGARDIVNVSGTNIVNDDSSRSHHRLDRKSKSANASTCSSASSFSRSCLSNTPSSSSRGKSGGETKRSVRFYPVSVIVDEDCRPCGHKTLYEDETRLKSAEFAHKSVHDKKREISEAARKLLRNYQKKVERKFDSIRNDEEDKKQYDDDDDNQSDSSSDLFELDNLSPIGMSKYREELPVYETTHLDTNRAIANGLFM